MAGYEILVCLCLSDLQPFLLLEKFLQGCIFVPRCSGLIAYSFRHVAYMICRAARVEVAGWDVYSEMV